MNTRACGCIEQPCDCCEGVQSSTPASECNRPGLDALSYRVGTHGAFLATMKARLSTMEVDGVGSDGQTVTTFRPLQRLTTRDSSDPSIALLDGWATVGDVLSFYQERIANEGYLRTATERRSVLELSNLVGYTLRPGVASTVYLAYTIDEKQTDPVTIPAGARVQSVPGPGETPQAFETSDPLEARSMWNTFKPRASRAQTAQSVLDSKSGGGRVYLQGINTNLKANDALVIDDGKKIDAYRVLTVVPDPALNRTLVTFAGWGTGTVAASHGASTEPPGAAAAAAPIDQTIGIMQRLTLPPSLPPRSALTVTRDLKATFISGQADIAGQIVTAFQPLLQGAFNAALANAPVTSRGSLHVCALRVKAAPFGQLAPRKSHFDKESGTLQDDGEWPIVDGFGADQVVHEQENAVFLDGEYDKIQPASYVLLDTSAVSSTTGIAQVKPAKPPYLITQAKSVQGGVARAAYGITGKTTRIDLADAWLDINPIQVLANHAETIGDRDFRVIRSTTIFAQSEELLLADEPVVDDICKGASSWIELDGSYNDLKSGRWAIVSGERADVTVPDPDDPTNTIAVSGIKASELVMLANVVQDVALPDGTPQSLYQAPATFDVVVPPPAPLGGEKRHTFLQFAKDLQYCYARDKVTIDGNVVKATHGETRNEVLGNGDGTKPLQSFTLKQPPLTFVAVPTAVGADSTLHAYVNDVEWHEIDSLAFLGAKDCGFVTSTDDAANTTLTFGNGVHGARVPTGLLNVKAIYRNGIGNAGNVRAEQISLLQTRPLGVKDVINPMRASGGADKESRDLARENAPLSVMSLDRLVSVQDYADFSRRFAGIAKALAAKTSDGGRELVYLTIAGVDDAPVDATSDLYRNLVEALHDLGDPDLPFRVDLRELKMLVLSAKIKILADYLWEPVVTAVRATLLDRFGFGKRALGQPVLLSEVIRVIQGVRGVAYVDVDALGAIPEKVADITKDGVVVRRLLIPAEITAQVQFVVDPDAVLKIARSPAARDRLPGNVGAWPGGSDGGALRPAELVIFTPAVPDTLVLNQIP